MSSFPPLTRQRIGALLFLLLSLFYGAQISDIPQLPVDAVEVMNARSFPWVLSCVGVLLSIALFVTGGESSPSSVAKGVTGFRARDVVSALLLLCWTALYAWFLGWLGFLLATALFLAGGFALLGERRALLIAGTALVAAGALFMVLRYGLGLYLPAGSLWSLLLSGGH